jgi:hypothetical protein
MASAESSAETAIGHAHNAARMLKPNEVKGVLGAMMRSFSGESGRLSFGWRATRRKTKRDWLARNAIPGPMNANVQRGRMRSRGFVPQSRAVAGSMAQWGQRRKVGIGDAPRGISCFHAFLICLLFLSPPLCGHSSSGTKTSSFVHCPARSAGGALLSSFNPSFSAKGQGRRFSIFHDSRCGSEPEKCVRKTIPSISNP